MSAIAEAHGATVDKFIGDAILAFFGDPETKCVVEDARACLRMAMAMQRRLVALTIDWPRRRGLQAPFMVRRGTHTGYLHLDNFGSSSRLDYTPTCANAHPATRPHTNAHPGPPLLP